MVGTDHARMHLRLLMEAGRSLRSIARDTGVGPTTLGNIVNGKCTAIRLSTARMLGVVVAADARTTIDA
ncbi:UNVERIFIED_CONTAM: hypothetical protein OHV15_06460 [Microbacterium sp. SLM126]